MAEVSVKSSNEKYVKSSFFISAITGVKLSQIKGTNREDLKFKIKSNNYSITEEINSMINCTINFNDDISLMTYGRVLRSLAKKAGIIGVINVHRKGKDMVCPKYKCLTSSVAINTYNAKVSKVNLSDDGSLFDLSAENKMNLPLDEWEKVDISATILESLTNNNISTMTLASKIEIEESELLSYIKGETPISLKMLGKLLWVLNLKLQ